MLSGNRKLIRLTGARGEGKGLAYLLSLGVTKENEQMGHISFSGQRSPYLEAGDDCTPMKEVAVQLVRTALDSSAHARPRGLLRAFLLD